MKVTLLGTGTSTGVPMLGCNCEVCTSAHSKDKRLRTSALVECRGRRILIDCGPDFRQQMLSGGGCTGFDAIVLTHEHSDHINGIDDIRPNRIFGTTHLYGEQRVVQSLRQRMPYCFGQTYPGAPDLHLHEVEPGKSFAVQDVNILPIRVLHGTLPIVGYRIENFAYITDCKYLPAESEALLQGLDALVINALRPTPHDTHQSLQEALVLAERLRVPKVRLTHINHDMGLHAQVNASLPSHIQLGYDGECLEL